MIILHLEEGEFLLVLSNIRSKSCLWFLGDLTLTTLVFSGLALNRILSDTM